MDCGLRPKIPMNTHGKFVMYGKSVIVLHYNCKIKYKMGKVTKRKCSNCHKSKNATQFIPNSKYRSKKGKLTKTCQKCQVYYNQVQHMGMLRYN